MANDNILVFAGSGSPKLTQDICDYLDIEQAKSEVFKFSEGNTFVRILENVRGRRVYLVQSTGFHANDNFMELLFWIDAFKRASAETVTVLMPYFSYAKGDKKDEPRVSIRARVCADTIEVAGANRVVTMDMHAPQIQGFFKLPVDDLYALPILCDAIENANLCEAKDLIVVSPDPGFIKKARAFAARLGTNIAIGDKERSAHDENAEILNIIGDVKDKTALIVDDVVLSGGTLVDMAETLLKKGAKEVYAAVTHGAISERSISKLVGSPIKKLFITDTIETQPVEMPEMIEVISVASLFAEAIKRIHNRESISVLFED